VTSAPEEEEEEGKVFAEAAQDFSSRLCTFFMFLGFRVHMSERLTVTCHRGFLAQRPVSVSQRRKRPVAMEAKAKASSPPLTIRGQKLSGEEPLGDESSPHNAKSPVFVKGCNHFGGPYDGI